MQWQKYGDFNYLSEQNDGSKSCVVLFHGYGADANDLASLAQIFNLQPPVDWVFPQGVLQVPIGPGMMGRAWVELRVSDFEKLQSNKQIEVNPQDELLIKKLRDWMNHLGKLYDNVVIGGFSQGAILTSHLFYHLNFAPKGLLLWSGYLMASGNVPQIANELKVPFYQSHGAQDPVLSLQGGQKLFNFLKDCGLKGEFHQFNGGHEIPMSVIQGSKKFLDSVLGGPE